jgi:hypothetical protein
MLEFLKKILLINFIQDKLEERKQKAIIAKRLEELRKRDPFIYK